MLRNFWYVAARSGDLADAPLARTVCGAPVVLFRDGQGRPAALRDFCSHRRAPLSMGTVVAGQLRCPYHGLRFDGAGHCVHIPTQSDIPRAADVPVWPVVERYGMIWVWPGAVEPGPLPDLPWREEAGWDAGIVQHFPVAAAARLMGDNLLDLSHVAFIHSGTIGFDPARLKDDPLVSETLGDTIRNTRIFPDVVPPPVHLAWHPFPGLVTRTSISTWSPPGRVSILVRNEDADVRLDLRIDHFMTPETAATHHYFVAIARNFRVGDAAFAAKLDAENERVHLQDVEIVAAQQAVIDRTPGHADMYLSQDKGMRVAHRILARLEGAA